MSLVDIAKLCFQPDLTTFHRELYPFTLHITSGLFHFSNLYFFSFIFSIVVLHWLFALLLTQVPFHSFILSGSLTCIFYCLPSINY